MATRDSKAVLKGDLHRVIDRLKELEQGDLNAEVKVATHGKLGFKAALLLICGMVVTIVIPPLGGLISSAAVGLIVYALIKAAIHSKYNIENQRYRLPLEVLESIAVDLDPQKEMTLKIDFRSSQQPAFVTKVDQARNFLGFASGTKVIHYLHPWLELEATTVLGHKVQLAMTRRVTRKEVPKRKRTKIKIRQFDIACLSVRPPRDEASSWVGQSAPLAPPQRHGLRSFSGQLGARGVSIKGVSQVSLAEPPQFSSQALLAMLMTAFRGLAQASKIAS